MGSLFHDRSGIAFIFCQISGFKNTDLRRRRNDFCRHSSYARILPENSAENFPRNSWWAYFYSDGKKRFPVTSQALFLSDLEGVIHSRIFLYNHPLLLFVVFLRRPGIYQHWQEGIACQHKKRLRNLLNRTRFQFEKDHEVHLPEHSAHRANTRSST